jgi:c-di-GMP-related signal transduction protein
MHELRNVDLRYLPRDKDTLRAVVNIVTNFPVPYNVDNFLTSRGTINFSSWSLLRGVSKIKAVSLA